MSTTAPSRAHASARSGTTCPARAGCCCRSWCSSSSAPAWCCPSTSSTCTRCATSRSSDVGLLLGAPAAGRLPRGRARAARRSTGSAPAGSCCGGAVAPGRRQPRARVRRDARRPAASALIAARASPSACPGRPSRASSPPWSRPSCGSATSGSTSPCSTSASGSAASSAALFVDVDRLGTFQAIYLADAASYLPPCSCCSVPLRHVGGPAVARRTSAPATAQVSYLEVLRRPAVALADAARLRGLVRRLLPAQRRHAGVRPRGRRGVDPGARLRVRRQHAGDRAAPAGGAAADRGPPPHPGDRGDGRRLGGVVAAARRRPGSSPAPSARPCWSRRAPRSSRSARRCSSRPSRRWSTTSRPTTSAAATTRSAPAPSSSRRSSPRRSPAS